MGREHRRPQGDDGGQEERSDRLRRRCLEPRLLADQGGGIEGRTERVGGRQAVPGGLGEDDQADGEREPRGARRGGEEQAAPLERDRQQGRGDRGTEQLRGGRAAQEDAPERQGRHRRQERCGDESDQTMRARGRSTGVCHRSCNLIEGARTITSHPARARDRRAWLARPSSCACRSGGRRTGSVG